MSAQNRYATLDSVGTGTEAPAPPSRRRTPERLTGRAALSVAPEITAPAPAAPAPVAPTAGDVFYDKGTATAANFRPSYWTYERNTAAEPPSEQPATAPAVREAVRNLAPEPVAQPSDEPTIDEPPAVAGMPPEPSAAIASHQPAAADELAATIEHVLVSRYAGARPVQDSTSKPRLVVTAVTADSLLAELAEARQSRSGEKKPAAARRSPQAPKKPMSLLDRAFAFGGIALVLFALLVLSPWRDSFLSPSISHFFG